MNTNKTFGEIVKGLREKKNLPLREVAKALNIDTSTLGKIEKNSRNPSKKLVEKIAIFFEVSKKELTIALLSDTVAYKILSEEDYANEVLKIAEIKVEYLKTKKKS